MITHNVLVASESLAHSVSNAGILLTPVNGSPLDVIIQTLNPVTLKGELTARNKVSLESQPMSPTFDPHTAEVSRISHALAQRVGGNIRFIKTVINPVCRGIIDECARVKKNIESDSVISVNLRNVSPLPIFGSSRLEDMIANYGQGVFNTSLVDPSLAGKLRPLLNRVSVIKTIKTNNDQFNGIVDSFIETTELLDYDIMDYLLSEVPTIPHGSIELLQSPIAVTNFLLLSGIQQGNLDGLDLNSLTLNEKASLSKAYAYYANRVYRQIENIRRMSKNKDFVFPAESNKKEVYVYERVYRDWINKEEGNIEVLIACVVKSNNMGSINTVIKNRTFNETDYENLAKRQVYTNRQVTVEQYRRVIESEMFKHLKSEEHDSDNIGVDLDRLRTFLKDYRLEVKDDIGQYVKRMVCEVLGKDTNAYSIISDMDAYLEAMPEATQQEAAVHASVKLLAKWASLQVTATKIEINESLPM